VEDETLMPFGKHAGTSLRALPDDYLDWLRRKATICSTELGDAVDEEYRRRWRESVAQEGPSGDFGVDDLRAFFG